MNKSIMSKKRMRVLAIGLSVMVVLGAAGYTLFIQPMIEKEEWIYKENEVQYGSLQVGVTESGTVAFKETTQLYDLDISTDDDEEDDDDDDDEEEEDEKYLRVAEVFVAVGQRIHKGDAIYRFTDDSVEDVRKALKYYKTEKEIALSTAKTAYEVGTLSAGLSYEESVLGSNLAESSYKNTMFTLQNEMTEKSLEIENILAEIVDLQKGIVDEDYWEQKEDIVEKYEDAVEDLKEDLDDFFTNSISSQTAYKNAKDSYDDFFSRMDDTNEEIQDKMDEVMDLLAALDRDRLLLRKQELLAEQEQQTSLTNGEIADSKYNSSIRDLQTELDTANDELAEATEKLEAFEEFVGDGTIYASGDGLVTAVGYEKDDKLKTEGVLVSFVQAEDMTIQVDVSQEDVVTMSVGQTVEIQFSAYKDEVYEGIVESITTTATSENTATVSYPVNITIQGDTSKLYSGMTADVTFVTDESEEVAYISRKAIVEENGKKYVYQKSGNQYVLTEIETGFSDGRNVEVVKGLQAGDVYYVASIVDKSAMQNSNSEQDEEPSGGIPQ